MVSRRGAALSCPMFVEVHGSLDDQQFLATPCVYGSDEAGDPDYESAFPLYKECAEAGDKDAYFFVGYFYSEGLGVEQDYKKGFKWLEKSARAGDAEGQYLVGLMYADGEGVRKDSYTAAQWMKKAAAQEQEQAQEWLEETFGGEIKFTTIEQLLLDLADEDSATILPPASEEDIEQCQQALAAKGFPPIPQEYLDFLRKCNGFAWGIWFFGTAAFSAYGSYSTHDGLVAANVYFTGLEHYDWLHHCLYLGEGCEKIFLYDPEKKLFRTWDYNAGLWDDYETFEAMFRDENDLGEDDSEPYKSMYELLEEAKQGDTEAMRQIGSRYHSGKSVYGEAVRWYEYAAFLGNADAQTSLYNMYLNEWGLPQDKEKAVYWMQHLKKHYPSQQEFIDEYITQGCGLDPNEYVMKYTDGDEEKALYWREKVAWTENPSLIIEEIKSMDELPDEDGDDDWLSHSEINKIRELANEHYDKEEYEEAFALYKQAAEAGDSYARFCLGLMYYYGDGTKQDYEQAYVWYERSAYGGNSDAQLNLALMYFKGEFVEENMEAGMRWMRESAEQGNEIAIENMKILDEADLEDASDDDGESDYAEMMELMEKYFELPEQELYCEKCETTNYIYDDMKPPYKCDNCGSLLKTEVI